MNEAIRAKVKLRCTVRPCASTETQLECVTEELARDFAVVVADARTAPAWLHRGRAVDFSVVLPAFRNQAPRIWECASLVRGWHRLGAGLRIELTIGSMTVLAIQQQS